MNIKAELAELLTSSGYKIVHDEEQPKEKIEPMYADKANILTLGTLSRRYLEIKNIAPFKHQIEGVARHKNGENVCISTGTASGKSLVFHLAALELIEQDPTAKILCLYPMKALGRDQLDKWKSVIDDMDLNVKVERIDGNTHKNERFVNLRKATVLIMTPDVLHAWLMPNLAKQEVTEFLNKLKLVIFDEVHLLKGVFGSNTSYLLRRLLNHASRANNEIPKLLFASATIPNAKDLLNRITGLNFSLVNEDSSAKYPINFLLAQPNDPNFTDPFLKLLNALKDRNSNFKFICFLDSRNLVSIFSEVANKMKSNEVFIDESEESIKQSLKKLRIAPYKSGMPFEEQQGILTEFKNDEIRGIVSTSALEIGMDIPSLNLCILFGVPPSNASFKQRIGRVGRKGAGNVIIINDGSIRSRVFFNNPSKIINNLPIEELRVYIENTNLQIVQAQILKHENSITGKEPIHSLFPETFIQRLDELNEGQVSDKHDNLLVEGIPHYTYSLRNFEPQYKGYLLQQGHLNTQEEIYSCSATQLLREAYPGALLRSSRQDVYRVNYINRKERKIILSKFHGTAFSKPKFLPRLTQVNLLNQAHFIHKSDSLNILDVSLNVTEAITGFKWGSTVNFSHDVSYPVVESGYKFDLPRLSRSFQTRGFIITHPDLNGAQTNLVADFLLRSLNIVAPFDQQDIGFGSGKLFINTLNEEWNGLQNKQKFIAIFDQGSYLELSTKLPTYKNILDSFQKCNSLINEVSAEEIAALGFSAEDIQEEGVPFKNESIIAIQSIINDLQNIPYGFTESSTKLGPVKVYADGTRLKLIARNIEAVITEIDNNDDEIYYRMRTIEAKNVIRTLKVRVDEEMELISPVPPKFYLYEDGTLITIQED